MPKYVYLAGSIQDARDGGVKWRDKLSPKLEAIGWTVFDPCKSEPNLIDGTLQDSKKAVEGYVASGQWDKFDRHMERIIDTDMDLVRRSDLIICYIDNSLKHGGTWCELWEASEHLKIPVYAISYDPKKDFNTWMLRTIRRNGEVFDSWTALLDALKDWDK